MYPKIFHERSVFCRPHQVFYMILRGQVSWFLIQVHARPPVFRDGFTIPKLDPVHNLPSEDAKETEIISWHCANVRPRVEAKTLVPWEAMTPCAMTCLMRGRVVVTRRDITTTRIVGTVNSFCTAGVWGMGTTSWRTKTVSPAVAPAPATMRPRGKLNQFPNITSTIMSVSNKWMEDRVLIFKKGKNRTSFQFKK